MPKASAKAEQSKPADLTPKEKGAAFIAWYKQCLQDHEQGLITRAQAAQILGISQTAVHRLCGRGHIRAVYFPKEPDVESISVMPDDPFWVKLMGVVGRVVDNPEAVEFVQACYVSLEDVVALWEEGRTEELVRFTWHDLLLKSTKELNEQNRSRRAKESAGQRKRKRDER